MSIINDKRWLLAKKKKQKVTNDLTKVIKEKYVLRYRFAKNTKKKKDETNN